MSIFSKFFFTLFGLSIPAWLREFISRVTGDGGTLSDRGHTKEVYIDTKPYDPNLIQSCDSGKATLLYSLFAFGDINAYETRVTADSGTTASTDHVIDVVHAIRNTGLYSESTIFVPCASGKATVLYSLIPN